jgi:hypothetical protein
LISFILRECNKSGQSALNPGASRIWRRFWQVAHKVIHKKRGDFQKPFQIIGLGREFDVAPSFSRQVHQALR